MECLEIRIYTVYKIVAWKQLLPSLRTIEVVIKQWEGINHVRALQSAMNAVNSAPAWSDSLHF